MHMQTLSAAGEEFTVNALIESSLTSTRLSQVYLYHLSGLRPDRMTPGELAEAFQRPPGIKVSIPVESVDSGVPIDLKRLLPSGFSASR
jgi:hypothetical protein